MDFFLGKGKMAVGSRLRMLTAQVIEDATSVKLKSLPILIALLLLVSLTSHAQFSLDSCFEGGVEGYKNHFAKNGRIATMPIKKGRYGLCLATMILSRNGKISQIEILSSPDSVYSNEVRRIFALAEGMWRYPKSMPVDSIRLMAGVYFVKTGDDRHSGPTHKGTTAYIRRIAQRLAA
jgi:hypothetical protein